jgi:diketogulonate reductase-like aldo/keto reductase
MTPKALTLQSSLPLASLPTARIPQLGFGVYRSPRDNCISSCSTALSAGYRHIDTAQFYHNEAEVGAAVRQAPLPRHELFLTTKIMRPSSSTKPGDMTFDRIRRSVDVMDVGGYVDLFLIHTPSSGRKGRRDLWEALGRAQREGLIRAAGVSNFGVGQIEELKGVEGCSWPPAVNQIEVCSSISSSPWRDS